MSPDIICEWREAIWTARLCADGVLPELAKHGIAPSHFRAVGGGGVAKVQIDRDGFYSPDEAGEIAIILPCRMWEISDDNSEGWTLIDLVALPVSDLERRAVRRGIAPLVGDTALRNELYLHASPLDWLRASGEGAVLLDWKPSVVRAVLAPYSALHVPTEAMAARLDRALRIPRDYTITVGRKSSAAA